MESGTMGKSLYSEIPHTALYTCDQIETFLESRDHIV